MTSTFATAGEPDVARAVTVALLGASLPAAATLSAALSALPTLQPARWRVIPADAVGPTTPVDIAVCDGPAGVSAAGRRWPAAATLALMPSGQDETGVLGALDVGAYVCVRDSPHSLVAAYLHSIARRRGLVTAQASR